MSKRLRADDLERLATGLKGRRLHEPPQGTLRKALALGGRLPESLGLAGRVLSIVFDSAREPLPAGVRSAVAGERRLLFRSSPADGADVVQLDLRLRREAGGAVEVTGQLLPPWEGARVTVRASGARRRSALGPDGDFLLRGLSGRAERLALRFEGAAGEVLEVGDIPVPEDDGGESA